MMLSSSGEHPDRFGNERRVVHPWTKAELDDMKANYRKLGWHAMCARLGRSKGSVTGKATELGLNGRWALVYDAIEGEK